MSDGPAEWLTVEAAKWFSYILVMIGIWVGAIEGRLRGKANLVDVAREPVEAGTIESSLNDLKKSLQAVKSGQDRNAEKLVRLGLNVATLMERTK